MRSAASGWAAIFFPDLPGANSDFSFLRLRQSAGSLFQFFSQGQYPADRFVVPDPMRELAVLIGLREKMADDLLLIHCALHLEQDDGAAKLFKFLSPARAIGPARFVVRTRGRNGFRASSPRLMAKLPNWSASFARPITTFVEEP
jgi:hypothetical protein